jgi:hypothetical protein
MKHSWQRLLPTFVVSGLLTFALLGAWCGGSTGGTSSNASTPTATVQREHCASSVHKAPDEPPSTPVVTCD